MRLACMYTLDAIGVDGELEAVDVRRFCSDACRDQYYADPDAVRQEFGRPIHRIYEGNDHKAETEHFPNGTNLVLLVKGEEDDPGDPAEVCNQCGVSLADVAEDHNPRRYLNERCDLPER